MRMILEMHMKNRFDDMFDVYEFHSTVSDDPTEFISELKKTNYLFSEDIYFWGIKK